MAEQQDAKTKSPRWSFDHRITMTHVLTILGILLVFLGGWHQLQQIDEVLKKQVEVSDQHAQEITATRERVVVLESQRRETNRRLDEIRDDVRFIRDRLERQPAP